MGQNKGNSFPLGSYDEIACGNGKLERNYNEINKRKL